jgi:hypothetical protein
MEFGMAGLHVWEWIVDRTRKDSAGSHVLQTRLQNFVGDEKFEQSLLYHRPSIALPWLRVKIPSLETILKE